VGDDDVRVLEVLPRPRDERLVLGGLTLEPHSRRAWRDGVELALTAREFDLLALFVGAPGRVFTRTQLLEAVWHTRLAAYEDNVNTHIARLRRHVEADPANPRYILTVRGVGYRSAAGAGDTGN
jgi:DNA-binding response OmpR family regulator